MGKRALYAAKGKHLALEEVHRKPAHTHTDTHASANQAEKIRNLSEEQNMILY